MTNEEMVAEIQAGRNVKQNMEQIYYNVKGLIYSIAKQYSDSCDIEDLTQEGYFGLKYAVDNYNPDRGATFVTYAYRPINTAIYRYYVHNVSSVALPIHLSEKYRKIVRAVNILLDKLEREPTNEEIARESGFSVSEVENIRHHYKKRNYSSLNAYANEEEDIQYISNIKAPDNIEDEVLDRVEQEELKVILWECVDELPGQHSEVLHKHYQENMQYKDIAKMYGISYQRVIQLREQAIRKLRCGKSYRRLKPFIEDIRSCAVQGTGVGTYNRSWTSATERVVLMREKYREMETDIAAQIRAELEEMNKADEQLKASLLRT